jgi:hypothetical protein
MFARVPSRQKLGRVRPELFASASGVDWSLQIEEPGENAGDVCFDQRDRLVESKGRDCIRGVTADAGQIADGIRRPWEATALLLIDGDRGGPQISGAGIIAEALPGVENFIFASGSKGSDRRKPAQPFIIIRNDGSDLGLLKHEFGNENGIWIRRSPPGEIAGVPAVPGKKRAAKGRVRFDKQKVGRLRVRSNHRHRR